jgi:hypothetical protein
MPVDDGVGGNGSGGDEEFKLLDIEGSAATAPSYRNTAATISVSEHKCGMWGSTILQWSHASANMCCGGGVQQGSLAIIQPVA